MRVPEQAQEDISPTKIDVTIKSPVGDISVVTLIRTDTTLDHSQKAEKVYLLKSIKQCLNQKKNEKSCEQAVKQSSTKPVNHKKQVGSCSQANYL